MKSLSLAEVNRKLRQSLAGVEAMTFTNIEQLKIIGQAVEDGYDPAFPTEYFHRLAASIERMAAAAHDVAMRIQKIPEKRSCH